MYTIIIKYSSTHILHSSLLEKNIQLYIIHLFLIKTNDNYLVNIYSHYSFVGNINFHTKNLSKYPIIKSNFLSKIFCFVTNSKYK